MMMSPVVNVRIVYWWFSLNLLGNAHEVIFFPVMNETIIA